MMRFIQDLSDEAKVSVGLIIAEYMFKLIEVNDDGYEIGREALDICWKWLEGEEIDANDLCDYIDSDDYVDVAEFTNKENNDTKQYAWYTVLDAVSYTIWQAYRKEGRKTFPQVVEAIDDETLIILGENAVESGFFKAEDINKMKNYFLKNDNKNNLINKKEFIDII